MNIYSESQLLEFINQGKELLLTSLEKDGVIENADKLKSDYVIVLTRQGWFGKVWDKFMNVEDGNIYITVLKTIKSDDLLSAKSLE